MHSRKSKHIRLGLLIATAGWFAACAVGGAPGREEPLATSEQAVHDEGLFEIDGNALNDPAVAGDDWENVLLGASGALAHTGVVADAPGATIFTGGGSKDISDISSWRHKNGAVPAKDDITDAYAAAYVNDAQELIIYFGADRYAVSGDSQLGFWFFKNEVSLNADGTFDGVHAVGDILVLADFTQGGAIGTVGVFEWVGSGGSDGALDAIPTGPVQGAGTDVYCTTDDAVCASINTSPTASPWPYQPKSGPANVFAPGAFFEGGINISQLVPGNTCFSSFMAETRSSQSPTATLKDFDLGSFHTCAMSVSKTCEVSELNPPGSPKLFTATFSATVTNSGVSAFPTGTVITIVDDAGTPDDTSDDVTQSITLAAPLGPGQSVTITGEFQTNDNPPNNGITATAVFGSSVITAHDTELCVELPLSPSLDVTKDCETKLVSQGGYVVVKVEFSGQVCNNGDVPLDITVTDDQAEELSLVDNHLNPGQCTSYTGSYRPATASEDPSSAAFTDTVTAVGTNLALGVEATDMATATCNLCPCL